MRKVHLAHCRQGDYADNCKYGEFDCPAISVEEQAAIAVYKNKYGKFWRSKLLLDWQKARAGPILQALRNRIGPFGLLDLK